MRDVHIKYNSIYKIFCLLIFPRCSTSITKQWGLISQFGSSRTLENFKVAVTRIWDHSYMSVHYLNSDRYSYKKVFIT